MCSGVSVSAQVLAPRRRPLPHQFKRGGLEHLGVHQEVWDVRALADPLHHGIGDIADAALQRQEIARDTACSEFLVQEIDNVSGDRLAGGIRRSKTMQLIALFGFDDSDDLFWINADVGLADAL